MRRHSRKMKSRVMLKNKSKVIKMRCNKITKKMRRGRNCIGG